jgi:tetratricopeptide (TPR) repeat protein
MRLRALRHLALVILGCGLLVLVARYSLGAYLAETSPEAALILDAGHPIALRSVAEKIVRDIEALDAKVAPPPQQPTDGIRFSAPAELASGAEGHGTGEDSLTPEKRAELLAQAREMVQRGLRTEPLDYRSLTLLARIVEMQSPETDAALPYYTEAARISPRASDAIFWLLRRNIGKGNYAEAVAQADTLLRTTSLARAAVLPILVHLAEKPEAAAHVQALLAANPPWREGFFGVAPNAITDARTPLTLLLGLKDTPHPPTDKELRGYLNFLVARGFYDLAYYTWLQFLPSESLARAGLLFNAGFDDPPSGFPFDWNIRTGGGTVVEFVPHPDEAGRRALSIEFSVGRVEFGGVTQSVLIPPGRYVLSGKRKGGIEGRRGLRWRVFCLGQPPRMLAETPMHLTPVHQWDAFELAFEVPANDCPMQQVRLNLDTRSTSEQLVRGTILYADMAIRRVPEAESKAPADD